MSDRLLPYVADRLRTAPLTYDEVGASMGALPAGFGHLEEEFVLGHGEPAFTAAADRLMRWGVQRGTAGIRVSASSDVVEEGAVAIIRLGFGPASVRAPLRVVAVVQEPGHRGFAYGTLPGHPESGEEFFVVSLAEGGTVTLRIRAFSRPRSQLAKLAGPLGRLAQRAITRGYGRSLR